MFWEHCDRDKRHGDLGIRIDMPELSGTLQSECFLEWINKIECVVGYKEVHGHVKMRFVVIILKGRGFHVVGVTALFSRLEWQIQD